MLVSTSKQMPCAFKSCTGAAQLPVGLVGRHQQAVGARIGFVAGGHRYEPGVNMERRFEGLDSMEALTDEQTARTSCGASTGKPPYYRSAPTRASQLRKQSSR